MQQNMERKHISLKMRTLMLDSEYFSKPMEDDATNHIRRFVQSMIR